jgi:4-hydroxymandelate synthase
MTVRDLGYVELYARDGASAIEYFTHRMDFTAIATATAPGGGSTALRNGPVQVVVTVPTAGHGPVAAHLDRHGDGIVDIALIRTDPAAGGPAQVPGPGRVRHTLLVADTSGPGPLPTDRRWTPLPGAPDPAPAATTPAASAPAATDTAADPVTRDPGALRVRALDHVALCVAAGTAEQVAQQYQDTLGMERFFVERIEIGGQAMDSVVVRSPSGRATFTIVAPGQSRPSGQLDDFLAANAGPGVQHLAFLVDDIVGDVRRARGRGVSFLETPDTYYDTLSARVGTLQEEVTDLRETRVLADRDEWGYLLQIFTRSPYPRRTLFYELIQRHSARGFGSANIRALYEAVERERVRTLVG